MTKTATATRTAFDYVEGQIKAEYNRHASWVDHYSEMEGMATSEKGKSKWRHCRRLAQKLKDDTLAILYAYQEGRSLRRLADQVHEAQEERRSLIAWLAGRPQEDPEHSRRAQSEINYLGEFLTDILHHLKQNNPGTQLASEAAYVLATIKTT
ncbi:MAG: hypothetical protein J6C44_06545 [Muribaculaceae bacterium]|nr:hypothetical protein [Muribaculaceae bacterium]MBO5187442.1 hypothetical protein [Prevotella sp.]